MTKKIIGVSLIIPSFIFIIQQFIQASSIFFGSYELIGFSCIGLALLGIKTMEIK